MKRVRDIFRRLRSLRLRSFRPRCLCAEDDVIGFESVEEVYERSGEVVPKPSHPKPVKASFHFILPGQCDETETQEDLNVPEEPEVNLQSEARPDPPEAASLGDLPEPPEDVILQEEPAQEPEPVLEIPAEPDVRAPEEEDNVPQASADECIQRPFPAGLQDFRCCAVLGEGSFGKVLLAEYIHTQDMFAIKAIKKTDVIERRCTKRLRYEKEIFQLMSSTRHPFLVNLFASIQDERYLFFVMEFAAGGDLLSNMLSINGPFPQDRAVFYAACVVLGLQCLHENKIIHRDLKPENVVLDREGFAKITDFGLSKAGIGFRDRTNSIVGTPAFMAPEMVTGLEYTRDVDWWNLGVLIYLMLVARMPFDVADDDGLDELIDKVVYSDVAYPYDLAPESISLIEDLLVKNPEMRLGSGERGAEDVKAHPVFRDIEWRKLSAKELRPPFLPPHSGPEDVSNFREDFTSMAPVLTPPEGPGLTDAWQDVFKDFDWTAEWAP